MRDLRLKRLYILHLLYNTTENEKLYRPERNKGCQRLGLREEADHRDTGGALGSDVTVLFLHFLAAPLLCTFQTT